MSLDRRVPTIPGKGHLFSESERSLACKLNRDFDLYAG